MDPESVIIECAAFAFDVCLFGLFYRLYKTKDECLKSLKEAQCFEINSELPKHVRDNGGVVPYAVVTGNVKALSKTPLRSQYFPHIRGVIRERITKERKVRWSPMLRIWSSADSEIQNTVSSIPFALYGRNSGYFKKQIAVEVVDPLSAQEMVLPRIFDEFKMHQDTIGEAVFGFFRGERTIGIHEFENMLSEDTNLTAVGKLIIENNELKIKSPDPKLTYFLTPLSLDSLIQKVNDSMKVYKVISIIMGSISLILFCYISKRVFSDLKRRINRARQLKKVEEERRLRRMADNTRRSIAVDSSPKCVICLEHPVEILILECGHACLCLDCSEHITDVCPVCRTRIQRLVPAFLP